MTYPNYPPPPGQQYQQAPPPPSSGTTQYAQQGQYTPAPPGQQAPVGPAPELNIVDPRGGSGGDWAPLPRHLIGHQYAALMLPRSFDPNNTMGTTVRPQVIVDMVIVNVGRNGETLPPIEFGDNQDRDYSKQRPNCFRLDAFPAEFSGARFTSQEIVKDLVEYVGTGALVAARFVQGQQGNRPPLLERLDPNDPARAALSEAWHQRVRQPGSLRRTVETGGLVHINGGPPVKQDNAAPTYAQQAGPAQGMPPQPGQHPGYGPPPGAQVNYQQAPPPPMPPPPGPAQVPPAAAAMGWTPEQWAAAPPNVKQAFGA